MQTAEAKAADARCDLNRPHVFIHAERAPGRPDGLPWPELAARVQARLQRLYPRAFFDARHDALRALAPLPTDEPSAAEALWRRATSSPARRGSRSGSATSTAAPRARAGACARRPTRRASGARWRPTAARSPTSSSAPTATSSTSSSTRRPHDRYGQAVDELIEYDRRRNAQLVETLERYLGARCSVAASARTLYIHPNTVRQRLERIERITGLDLRNEDLLSLELALKVRACTACAGTECPRCRGDAGPARP